MKLFQSPVDKSWVNHAGHPKGDAVDFGWLKKYNNSNQDIKAIGKGKVVYTGHLRDAGNTVVIAHDYDGKNDLWIGYSHLDKYNVSVGKSVNAGDKIGNMGNTGISHGNHLHLRAAFAPKGKSFTWGAYNSYARINPLDFLRKLPSQEVEGLRPMPVEAPKPSKPTGSLKVGDSVEVNGVVHANSAGARPGIALKNHKGKITSVVSGNKFPYHIDKLGWVSADAVGANKPAPSKPAPSNKKYINIHEGKEYGIYQLNVQPVAKNIKHRLNPNIVRDGKKGLSYEIKGKTKYGDVYFIQTRDFGKVQIYHDKKRASITDKPLYKVMG